MYVEHGYTHVCCTPHVWPTLQDNTVINIRRRTLALQQELTRAAIPLKLIPGGEINLLWEWPGLREKDLADIVSYGLRGGVLLFDFWADALPDFLGPATEYLQAKGFRLVMAHPERVKAVQHDLSSADRFIAQGILLQCNTWCLRDPPGAPTRQISERLLREGKYHLLGTDLHDFKSMPPRMEGLQKAIDMIGDDAVHLLTVENPRALLREDVHADLPTAAEVM
jgi:protein-tyrosine phosphatase